MHLEIFTFARTSGSEGSSGYCCSFGMSADASLPALGLNVNISITESSSVGIKLFN